MNLNVRNAIESPVPQGSRERVAYSLDYTVLGTPASGSTALYDSTGSNVTATNLSGSTTISGNVVTTPLVVSLTAGTTYTMYVQVVIGGNTLETVCQIVGQT